MAGGGEDANICTFPHRISPSRLRTSSAHPWTTLLVRQSRALVCMQEFGFLRLKPAIECYKTLSRGVGKRSGYVLSCIVFFLGSGEVSRYPGSSDESPGDWHSYPSRTQEAKKAQLIERSRGLELGVLPLMARTRRCCTPHEF
jgi:hypothetical protein